MGPKKGNKTRAQSAKSPKPGKPADTKPSKKPGKRAKSSEVPTGLYRVVTPIRVTSPENHVFELALGAVLSPGQTDDGSYVLRDVVGTPLVAFEDSTELHAWLEKHAAKQDAPDER